LIHGGTVANRDEHGDLRLSKVLPAPKRYAGRIRRYAGDKGDTSMSLTLSPETERLLRRKARDGGYASVDDLIRDALRALDERNALLTAVAEGENDVSAGPVRPLTKSRPIARNEEMTADGRDPLIGVFAEDAELLDQIEADIMRRRETQPWRTEDGGETTA
jgi:putative addiction module CopG family antidote